MNRVRKAVDAHGEDFVVNDELLLPIQTKEKQSYSAHAHYTLLEMLQPVTPTNTVQLSQHRP
jgi:hypothetical protein